MTSLPPLLKSKTTKDKRLRSDRHRKWVRSHRCSVPGCERVPIECAHVRTGTDGAMGRKPSDKWCISLCGGIDGHHAEQHRIGEPEFERRYGIDMKALAKLFAKRSPFKARLEQQ